MKRFDLIVLGAGAAGLMCAGVAGQLGCSVLVIDSSDRIAEKIRISGGGRCNFTNRDADRPERFVSSEPQVVRDVLRGYPPARFIELVSRHRIGFHEKHRGQLFCDDSSERIIAMLRAECDAGRVELRAPCRVASIAQGDDGYRVQTDAGEVVAQALVVATGGLSIPAIGASDFGYRIARQFGLRVITTRPALVPLRFDPNAWAPFAALAGISLPVGIATGGSPSAAAGAPTVTAAAAPTVPAAAAPTVAAAVAPTVAAAVAPTVAAAVAQAADAVPGMEFDEDLLFTHRGLSGPAILQISSYWYPGSPLTIDLTRARARELGRPLRDLLQEARRSSRQQVESVLATLMPRRLALGWLGHARKGVHAAKIGRRIAELAARDVEALAVDLTAWQVLPSGSEGYRKAEVTAGGVALSELDPLSGAARSQPGLYFIGEVVDVTGWLGGYNFQWAWASAWRAAQAVSAARRKGRL